MFGIGLGEIIIIVLALLIILGPEQIQKFSRAIGKSINELGRIKTDFLDSVNTTMKEKDEENLESGDDKDFQEAPSVIPEVYCQISNSNNINSLEKED